MNLARNLIHRWLRSFNYDVRRYVCPHGKTLAVLALAIRSFLTENPDLYFLQIGANDGLIDDPIHPLVRKHRLRGLLLEPVPAFFEELKSNYADQPQLQFERAALWKEDGAQQFFRIRHEAYENRRIKGMAGLSREKLMAASTYLPGLAGNIESFPVPTISPASLLRKHGVTRVDLLIVDTEGLDDQMIYLLFDAGLSPAMVYFEHIHLDAGRQDACCDFLSRRGYAFARSRTDTLAMNAPGLTA